MPMCNMRSEWRWSVAGLHGVGTGLAVTLLEFLPRTDSLHIHDPIDGENPIEVINFVLQQFGKITVFSCLHLEHLTVHVLITHSYLAVTFNLHENGKKAQAGVPDYDFFFAPPDYLRVDQRPGFRAGQSQEDHALQHT